jgi:hypothetical protein
MRPETLLAYVRAAPFRPFRIVLNSGRAYDVRHQDLLQVGRDCFVLFYAAEQGGPFDRWETASLLLIDHIEHLDVPAASSA